jgi:hypothetical protein
MILYSLSSLFHEYYLFFVYGLIAGYFFKLWQIIKQKFPLADVLLYTQGLWLVFVIIWMAMQLDSISAWCVFGSAVFFTQIIPLPAISLTYFKKKRSEAQWRKQARKWREQREREHRAYQHQAEFKRWEEQFRREQTAKAYQAWQESVKQKQNSQQQDIKQASHQDRRSDEQILGLPLGWTQADLKKAYQREAQRTHPDKWVGKPESLRKQMEDEYKSL